MKVPIKQILKATRARAAGQSWNATAEAVRRSVTIVKTWPDRYPAEWKRCLEQAQCEIQVEAKAEAVATLRSQLRDQKSPAAAAAAKALLQWLIRATKQLHEADLTDEDLFNRFVESLNAGQAENLDQELKALGAGNESETDRE